MSGPAAIVFSLAALLVAGYAAFKARGAATRARQSLATIDELLTLVEQLVEEGRPVGPAAAEDDDRENREPARAPAHDDKVGDMVPAQRAGDGPAAPPATGDVRITPQLRAVVPDLYGKGTPVAEIARRSGLSRGEVRLLVALSERSRRSAG